MVALPAAAPSWYARFSQAVSRLSGRPAAFVLVIAFTLAWVVSGPLFGFSDTWQLVMNTISSIVTFLMVFVIQNTQNRQTEAMQIKLDELIRATEGAHNALLDLEDVDDTQLMEFRNRYVELAQFARAELARRRHDTGTPEPPEAPTPPSR